VGGGGFRAACDKGLFVDMQMQACGQPPDEIVQDLAPGLSFGEDGLPQLPSSGADNCVIC
jgi:hypothetical protein